MSDYAAFSVPNVATAQNIATSTTAAPSAALRAGDWMCVVTALTYVMRGPTAVATSSCPALAPNVPHVLRGVQDGDKLSFLADTGTGKAIIWPAQ